MNAPFNSGRIGHREPFIAYVCDETTAEVVRPIAVEMGWVARKGEQGRAAQRRPVAVGLGEPEDPVRRPVRIGRSAERHQRARRSLRARHGRDRRRPGQRRAAVPRSRRQRHPGLSAQAAQSRHAARGVRPRADDAQRAEARRCQRRAAALLDRGYRHARRRRRLDHRDLARLAVEREGRAHDRAARSRRAFRHRRAGARSRARPRPDRRDRESQPHRRAVHRTRDGEGQRHAVGAVGRSADQLAGADRWRRLLPAPGGDARARSNARWSICRATCWSSIRT